MGLKKRLSRSNWELLRQSPLTMWLGVCVVDTVAGSLRKEAQAFDTALADGTKRYDHNKLIMTVVAEANKPSKSQERGNCTVQPQVLLKQLRRVSCVLERGVDESDAEEFTRFLLGIGWTVARASAESPMGSKVSKEEEKFLYQADRALHSASDTANDAANDADVT